MKEFIRKSLRDLNSQLKNYVYIYSDPETGIPFYVGKGKGGRALDHLDDVGDNEKARTIKKILEGQGKEPLMEFLIYGVDEDIALKVEAAAIDLIGIDNLANRQRGHHAKEYGRVTIPELVGRLKNEEIKITEKVILIRINQLYNASYEPIKLYDVTRGVWKVNKEKADKAKFAMAVFNGQIKEVYEIISWFKAGTTFSSMHNKEEVVNNEKLKGRYEFIGNIAEKSIRDKYINKMVMRGIFVKGNQNPIRYINIDGKTVSEE